jgi:hypothetical protein
MEDNNQNVPNQTTPGATNTSPQVADEYSTPIPQGATTAPPQNEYSTPIPQGATTTPPTAESGGILSTLGNVATGAGKEFMHTVGSVYDLASKIPGVKTALATADKYAGFSPEAEQNMHNTAQAPLQGTAENIGGGLETVGEFLLGDAALKGLSLADRLTKVSKVMKFVEQSPRLAQALRLGISVGKAGAELSPEERALLQKYPTLARLAGVGLDAIRQGTVQAAQTGVKTGGDLGEAATSGAEMAAGSAALGAPLAALGGALEHGGQAANAVENLRTTAQNAPTATEGNAALQQAVTTATQPEVEAAQAAKTEAEGKLAGAKAAIAEPGGYADNAPTKEQLTNKAQAYAKAGEHAVRDEYTKASAAIRNDPALEGLTIPGKGSAFQEKAANAAFGQQQGDAVRKALGASIPASPEVMNLVSELGKPGGLLEVDEAGNPKEMDINQLMDYAKDVKDQLRKVGYSTPQEMRDRQAYYDLLDGIHESVDELVAKAGKPELMDKLQAMNANYKNGIQTFKNPDVQALLRGSNENAIVTTLTGGKSVGDINAIRKAIGKEAFGHLADDAMQRIAADSTNPATGEFDLKRWITNMGKIPDDVRAEMVNGTKKGGALENILGHVRDVAQSGTIENSDKAMQASQDAIKAILGNSADLIGILKQPENVQQLAQLVGPDAMGTLGDTILRSQLREAATNAKGEVGNVNTGKFLDFVSKLKDSPEVVDAFFKPTPERAAAYDKLLQSVHNVDHVKEMIKLGVIAPVIGAAAGGAVGHTGLSLMLGAAAAESAGGSIKLARDILDSIANHPATWGTIRALNNTAQSPVTKAATHIAKVATGKYVAPSLKDVLSNTQTQLSNR